MRWRLRQLLQKTSRSFPGSVLLTLPDACVFLEPPDEEATTIAGLVIHDARMIPDVGQVFNFHGFRLEVLKKRKHQVTSLKLTPENLG